MTASPTGQQRSLSRLAAATVTTYLVGYSLVLVAHSPVGWVFVSLGGLLLLATGIQTVRYLHRRSGDDGLTRPAGAEPHPALGDAASERGS